MAEGQDNPLVKVVESLPAVPVTSRPGLVRGLSYLLGGLGNYLGAWLRRPVQAVEDRTDARTVITRAIALAAAEKLSSDPDIVSAAISQWGPADMSRQFNKMKIAREVIHDLSSDEHLSNDPQETSPPPSDDFLNSFERFCADSSEDSMQKLWARLLAGEIRKPGSFSRHTMRCLYELDSDTAILFEKVAKRTIGHVLLYDTDDDIHTHEINRLQTAGLITGGGGIYNFKFQFNEKGFAILKGQQFLITAKKTEGGNDFSITSYPLSQAGIELLSLLPDYDERSACIRLVDQLPLDKVSEIAIAPFSTDSGELEIGSVEKLRPSG